MHGGQVQGREARCPLPLLPGGAETEWSHVQAEGNIASVGPRRDPRWQHRLDRREISASVIARRPRVRQPLTDDSRAGAEASAVVRSGSSGDRARALPRRRAASTSFLSVTEASRASAITAWTGVDRGHPVMVRAAVLISLSSSSTCGGAAAGSQVAAACSRAPRT